MGPQNPQLAPAEHRLTARTAREQDAILRSAERMQSLLRDGSCAIHAVEFVQVDPADLPEPILVVWNVGAEKIYGHPAEQVLGRPVSLLVPPDRLDEYRDITRRVFRGELIEDLETVRLHKDGRRLDVVLSIVPIERPPARFPEQGDGETPRPIVVGSVAITRDVTDQRRMERALRESEQRFQMFMDYGPTMAFMKDAQGRYVYANRAFAEALGQPGSQWLGKTDWDLFPESVARQLREQDELVLRERRVLQVEHEVRFSDGRTLPALTVKFPFETGPAGLHVGGVAIDISEREASRRERAALVHQLRERIKDLTALHELARLLQDKRLDVPELLQAAVKLLPPAWQFPEITAARITLGGEWFATPDFEPTPRGQMATCFLADGRLLTIEVVYRAERPKVPGGEGPFVIEERWLLDSFAEMLAGHLDALRSAEALVRSERRHRAIVETVRDVIFTISPGGQLTSLSPAFETMTGWKCDDWVGKPFTPLIHPDDLRLAIEMFQSVLDGNTPRLFQIRIRRADGEYIVGEFTATPQMDEGRLVSVLGVARDVTQRIALEERLAQAEKMEAVGRFAGGIAHDFNNVLTAINGSADLLLEHLPPSDTNRELAVEISEAVERAAALTRQLLLFSRREPHSPTQLDLNELVRGLRKLLARLMNDHIELVLDLDSALGAITADPPRIEQAIVNLVVNARDAMPGGGRVTIRTRPVRIDDQSPLAADGLQPGDYALLEVADTGCGIDEAALPRVFEPFFTTKKPGAGTGLGLSTVFSIIQQCGGHIGIESAPQKGTTVRIHLPAAAPGP